MLMLIDTREPPDDGKGGGREPWLVRVLAFLLPWPAIIVWLCAAGLLLNGWPAVACSFLAIGLSAWRGARLMPSDGLDQQRQ